MIDTGPDPAEATARLSEADRVRGAVRQRGSWYVRYQLAYGTAMFAATMLLGMVSTWWSPAVVIIGALTLGLVLWRRAQRQPVSRRAWHRCPEINVAAAVSLPIYMTVCLAGFTFFEQNLAWWLPGAAVAAAPWFVHGYREARR